VPGIALDRIIGLVCRGKRVEVFGKSLLFIKTAHCSRRNYIAVWRLLPRRFFVGHSTEDSNQQNKVLDSGEKQRIRITVPHHPLYNQTLKVHRHLYGEDNHEIVVELPSGKTQLIPAHWTEAMPSTPRDSLHALVLFNSDSLRALLTMVTSLITKQQPEVCNEHDTHRPAVANVQSGKPATDYSSVGRSSPPPNPSPTVAPTRRNR